MPMKNRNVQNHGSGLTREADCAVLKALSVVYEEITPEELQAFIGLKQPERIDRLRGAVLGRAVLGKSKKSYVSLKASNLLGGKEVSYDILEFTAIWSNFYKEVLGITLEHPISIPGHKDGFDFLIIMAKGLTHKMISNVEVNLYSTYKYQSDLDNATDQTKEERTTKKSYAIWIQDSIEAPEDLKNVSASEIERRKLKTMTLLERRLLELFYYWTTKKHLDIDNWTLCAGSRYSDGYVPRTCWFPSDGRFHVGWCYASYSYSYLRARTVVSY